MIRIWILIEKQILKELGFSELGQRLERQENFKVENLGLGEAFWMSLQYIVLRI